MTSGQDLVNAALTFLGEPYSTAPGRTSPTSGFKDCSGLIAASYEVATGQELGAYISVTIWKQSADQGLAIPRDEAFGIAGACLLMPNNPLLGWGDAGHIGFSDGQGGTVEATPPRVQQLANTYQPWGVEACLLPGIDYSNGGQGGATPTPQENTMLPMLIQAPGDTKVYVYDPNANTICWLRTPEDLKTVQDLWAFIRASGGQAGNPEVVENGTAAALIRGAVDLRASATTPGDCPGIDSYSGPELYSALGPHIQ